MQPTGDAHPILFAHRGGRAHAKGNTMPAFAEALRRGAPGIESDVRMTADGAPVLIHDPVFGFRRRKVAETPAAKLPASLTTLRDLYLTYGTAFALSLDVKIGTAFDPTVAVAVELGAVDNLWLCGSFDDVIGWREHDARPHLVHSTRLRLIERDLAGHISRLAAGGVEAVNLPARDWNQRTIDIVHEGGVLAFGWDAHRLAAVRRLVGLGCDGVYGDDVDALLAGARTA